MHHARSVLFGALMLVMAVSAVSLALPHRVAAGETQPIKVLVSTFPVYQFTRNITAGSTLLQVDLMIPAQLGCPHDYALTPQDMHKLGEAQIFIINGLGLEEFLGAPLERANPNITVIDSSKDVKEVLAYDDQGAEDKEDTHHSDHDHNHDGHAEEAHAQHGHDSGPNPHIFASPRMAALQVDNIAKALAEAAPAEKELFTKNAQAYAQKLTALDKEFQQLGKRLAKTRIVTQHGVFDYLARDMGLEIVAVIAAHPGQDPSAAEALHLVQAIQAKKAGAIFTEPQYPDSIAQTIARESGIPLAVLDPVANGPGQQAPLDYYQSTMRTNLKTLADTLGTK